MEKTYKIINKGKKPSKKPQSIKMILQGSTTESDDPTKDVTIASKLDDSESEEFDLAHPFKIIKRRSQGKIPSLKDTSKDESLALRKKKITLVV